jgi:predicted metal-dependent phosphoesterase TrpH
MIDLHLHSIFSDGLDRPSELIDKAIDLNLKAIAITDHDTVDGVEELLS